MKRLLSQCAAFAQEGYARRCVDLHLQRAQPGPADARVPPRQRRGQCRVGSAAPDVDVEYGYDTLGQLATVKDWKQSGSNVSTNFYDLAGVLTETSYPNTMRQKFDRTEQNRLNKVTWEQNTGSAMVARKRFTYQLNLTGQRTQVIEDDGTTTQRTVHYAYDSAVSPPVIGISG